MVRCTPANIPEGSWSMTQRPSRGARLPVSPAGGFWARMGMSWCSLPGTIQSFGRANSKAVVLVRQVRSLRLRLIEPLNQDWSDVLPESVDQTVAIGSH